MSGQSAQQKGADELSLFQSNLARQLSGQTVPILQKLAGPGGVLTNELASTSNGQVMSSWDQQAANEASSELDRSFGQTKFGNREAINYRALRSGESRRSAFVPGSAIASTATRLDQDISKAKANLEFRSKTAAMGNYNNFLSLMGATGNTGLRLAQGFSGAAGGALGGMSNQSQLGSTLGGFGTGAATGAAIGSIIPGVGTVIGGLAGGVVGGAAGYLGSG